MIYQHAKQMSCGNCGHQNFGIYKEENEDNPGGLRILIVECLKCNSTSLISFREPELTIDFGYKSDGCLCILK